MIRSLICILHVFPVFMCFMCIGAQAGVRVEDDEVIFSLRAPDATRVFLVGDFNNWNPTLERMDRSGDTFIIRLYLLPGTYRYKYVVDGEWVVDPDNPPVDKKRGSPLVLEERAGMLTLGSGEPIDEPGVGTLQPSLRYTGAFVVDDSETSSTQTFDLYLGYEGKLVRSSVDFKTTDEALDLSPLAADIRFNRGFLDLQVGDAHVRAFENDTIWTSNDPYRLVGDVGIFDYNSGYQRKGFTLEVPLLFKMRMRAMYADRFEQSPAPLALPAEAFGDFAVSNTGDTLVYRFDKSLDDADTWAVDLFADAGSFDFGYSSRRNRGLHPGIVADVERGNGDFGLLAYNTREEWQAGVVWLRWSVYRGIRIGGGFGYSDARILQTARSSSRLTSLADVSIGQGAQRFDGEIPLQSSKRWNGSIEFERDNFNVVAIYEWNEFEFDPFVTSGSLAEISTIGLDASYKAGPWSVNAVAGYIDQDYGKTPTVFHFYTPARNFWLDWGDRLDTKGMVSFDLPRATNLTLNVGVNTAADEAHDTVRSIVPAITVRADVVSSDFFERIEAVSLRAGGEIGLGRGIYLGLAGRAAHYDKPSWGVAETYFTSYVEAGYRNDWTEISLGIGPDPVVLDDVANAYRDNGWDQKLREQIPADLTRDDVRALGDALQASEKSLEDNHALKLEVILYF